MDNAECGLSAPVTNRLESRETLAYRATIKNVIQPTTARSVADSTTYTESQLLPSHAMLSLSGRGSMSAPRERLVKRLCDPRLDIRFRLIESEKTWGALWEPCFSRTAYRSKGTVKGAFDGVCDTG